MSVHLKGGVVTQEEHKQGSDGRTNFQSSVCIHPFGLKANNLPGIVPIIHAISEPFPIVKIMIMGGKQRPPAQTHASTAICDLLPVETE